MNRDDLINDYFVWLYETVCRNKFAKQISYKRVFMHLHSTEFIALMRADMDRADDGIQLRYRFAYERGGIKNIEDYLDGPCTVLEMMVALAVRCEETIMDDPDIGDRTGQWFWGMMVNLGLGSMYDNLYDRASVDSIISRFNNREYSADGRGGLFTIRNCDRDLRSVDIWHQLCWYLNTIA